MKRYLMQIVYDGTDFCGWQIQSNGRTVQETIEKVLSKIAKCKVAIAGSGRTDSGVHAQRQYAHFDFDLAMTPRQIMLALNSKMPADISITDVKEVRSDFHARYDAIARKYHYHIAKEKTPFNRRFCSIIPKAVFSKDKIVETMNYFLGEHDFTSFSKLNPVLKHNRCRIKSFTYEEKDDVVIFEIEANRFLHNMVRRIVGTVMNICITDSDPQIVRTLIANENPGHKLIMTAPPNGLFLEDVIYSFSVDEG